MFDLTDDLIIIISNLGREGLKCEQISSPVVEVISSLQEIGIECAILQNENLSIEIINRLYLIATESKRDSPTFDLSLSSIWIVSAYLNKNISDTYNWSLQNVLRIKSDYNLAFYASFKNALLELEETSCVGLSILECKLPRTSSI